MPTPTDALTRQGRFDLAPTATQQLSRRLITWTLWQAAAWLGLVALGLSGSVWAPVLALGLAASTARPRHLPLAVFVVPAVVAAAWLASLASLPVWSAAGLVAGLAAAWLELGRRPTWRLANAALAGAALFPVAVMTQQTLAQALPPVLAAPVSILCASLIPALTLAVVAVDWHAVARIPSPRRIRATLAARYRDPCLKAWETDRVVRDMAPDRETREGLGEVAAWVYRLSLALQEQDQELELLAGEGISAKVQAARDAVQATDDPYTRDRRQATLRHLELMERHADALALERQRTESLLDYASATLAEARAGLAFSRKGASFPAPEGLDQVLGRLRAHATDQAARRDTARELEAAPV